MSAWELALPPLYTLAKAESHANSRKILEHNVSNVGFAFGDPGGYNQIDDPQHFRELTFSIESIR